MTTKAQQMTINKTTGTQLYLMTRDDLDPTTIEHQLWGELLRAVVSAESESDAAKVMIEDGNIEHYSIKEIGLSIVSRGVIIYDYHTK